MQNETILRRKCEYSESNFARLRRSKEHKTRGKTKNSILSIKTPILSNKSELIFQDNPKKLLKLLYPIGKHYINDEIPNMDIYKFNHFLLKKITESLDVWNIYEKPGGELEFWTGSGEGHDNGFCAEISWIFDLKEDWQNFMWDYFSYLVQKFHIPFLHNFDYMIDVTEDSFTDNLEDIDDIDEMDNIKRTIKMYRDKVLPLYQKINFEKSFDTENTLRQKLSKIKINNYKDQKLLAWIEDGFRIITVDFHNFIPFRALVSSEDSDDYMFGPEYYANFLWSIDENDYVFRTYEEQGQFYYNNCEILPFFEEIQLTPKKPFLKKYNNEFPEAFKKWLEDSYLIYE
tara:strand:+ start:551 stop:1582 length:1032 start_codon:yes stop_codon:yes gene_type:complete